MTWRVINDSLLIGRYSVKTAMQLAQNGKAERKIAIFDFVCLYYEIKAGSWRDRC